ncbi:MAG TPA: alpha-hydroxy acid oxidase [Acidimicrobiales bacterium]|jgi:L-lactate dehydrogenase (cytochrome)
MAQGRGGALRSVLRFRRVSLDADERRLAHVASVDDLRRIARRRLPHGVFDYVDGGAEDELTLARNVSAFRSIAFRPRVLRDVGKVDPSTALFDRPLPLPLILAPTGFTRIVCPEGELAVARAAASAGLPYTLSTMSTRSIEEVAEVSSGPKWFQVYVWRDRALVKDMLERASACGYETIVITVDTAMLGRRERDVRRGFMMPPRLGLGTLVDGALHPAWTWAFARSDPITFANVASHRGDAVSLSDHVNHQFDPSLSWADIEWFRANWDGHIVIKGIQTIDDAVLSVDHGIDGIALSNHGGRQLDGAPAPISLVAPVRDRVGDAITVICDGGVRRGSDIVKAIALGADACMIGRAYLYALGAAGETGVRWLLDNLQSGVERTLTLVGATSLSDLTPDIVVMLQRPGV